MSQQRAVKYNVCEICGVQLYSGIYSLCDRCFSSEFDEFSEEPEDEEKEINEDNELQGSL